MPENTTIPLCRIELPAEIGSLPAFNEKVTQCAVECGISQHKLMSLELALEEAIVNIIKYASTDPEGTVLIDCSLDGEKYFTITITDNGPPFDPLQRTAPDTHADIDDRPIGGLGIFLIKEMTDSVSYHREDNKNILTIKMEK
ncbi:MAG: ATP-binding protein [Syntrophorhabdus sp.]